jgi:hypothetical protein
MLFHPTENISLQKNFVEKITSFIADQDISEHINTLL